MLCGRDLGGSQRRRGWAEERSHSNAGLIAAAVAMQSHVGSREGRGTKQTKDHNKPLMSNIN